MKTQEGKTRIVVVACALAALSGLSLMVLAADRGFPGGSIDYFGAAAPDAILMPSATAAAAYIKFDGIDGESQDRDHRDWSNILSFSQGKFVPSDTATGRARGGVVLEDILVTKELDKSSPKLAEAVCKGTHFPTVEIHWTKAVPGGRVTYYAYELKNVQVTGYHIGGSARSDQTPTEELSLNFSEIKVTYTEFDETGRVKGKVEYSWKVEEGTT